MREYLMKPEKLNLASSDRVECVSCKLFASCKTPFMRPFIPKEYTGKILGIAEAPGQHEDEISHRPLTGKAGKLLAECFSAARYDARDIALVNALRCRPKHNATPHMNQIRACRPFLLQVISVLKPQMIICFGAISIKSLQDNALSNITKLRGRPLVCPEFPDIPAYCTWHPAAVFYSEGYRLKNEIITDLKNMKENIIPCPNSSIPEDGGMIAIDTEYTKDKQLLTLGIANDKSANAEDIAKS